MCLSGLSGDVSKSFTYDGGGVLRTNVVGGVTTRIVAPDYRVNASTGEAFVLYGFMGRQVAWGDNTSLKYLLADHLSSSHGEVSTGQSELGQRRAFPFGSDRAVSGASDLTTEERFTGQRRLDTGNGNGRRELYYYGARWYLPGVGVFSQPDMAGIQRRNPQSLNRYAYVLNNPARYIDPTGLQSEDENEPQGAVDPEVALKEYLLTDQPNWFDEAWQWDFRAANGWAPTTADYWDRYVSMAEASGMGDDAGLTAQVQTVLYGGPPQPNNPDYYAFSVTAGPVAGQVTVDDYGQVYIGGGWNLGTTLPSVSATAGWIVVGEPQSEPEREEALRSFLTGWANTYGAGFGPGEFVTISTSSGAVAIEMGPTTPMAGASGVYSWALPAWLVPWRIGSR